MSSRERWSRLRQALWQAPRPHGEQPRERTVGPLELFYDLAVVAAVAQAAHHLAGHLTWHGLGEFAAVFTLVWIAWANGSLHHELHGREDVRGRSTFLVQILVLAAMGAFIPGAGGDRGAAFAVATAVLFAILALLWLLVARRDRPEYRRPSLWFVALTTACAAALAGTAVLPPAARLAGWGVLDAVYLAGFVAIIVAVPAAPVVAMSVTPSLIDRFGALTIIVLGETLTGVVAGLAHAPVNALTLAVGLVAVVVGFGAWWTYFDFAGNRPARRRRRAGLHDDDRREPAGLDGRPGPVPAAVADLRRRGRGLPGRGRAASPAADPRPGADRLPRRPVELRRCPPPGQRCRFAPRLTPAYARTRRGSRPRNAPYRAAASSSVLSCGGVSGR
jgi:hypothetical protein